MHFTQADIAEFEHYRDQLDDLTAPRRGMADTTPAYEIFNRFLERLEQRVTYGNQLLKTEKFEFDTDEQMTINRHEAPYPKDLTEAKALWKQRLRYEYLLEKMAKNGAKPKVVKLEIKNEGTNAPATKETKTVPAPAKEVKKKTDVEEIVDTLTRRYARNLRLFVDWDSEDVLQVYLTALAHVYDPHSDYFNEHGAENFAIGMNLSLFGIGAELKSEDGYCTINKLVSGGPAAKSKKLKEKDRIVAVAQADAAPVDVVEMPLNKIVSMIRGPKGTEVRLTVVAAAGGDADRQVISLIRDEIRLEDQAAKAKVIEIPDAKGKMQRLGVIDLPSFYGTIDMGGPRPIDLASPLGGGGASSRPAVRSAAVDVARLLKKLEAEGVSGVILDLRHNGGGLLEEAVKITGLFIKEGPVVQVRNWDGSVIVDEDTDESVLYDGPLIVLTSRFSASASEILAGALQDYGRAVLVGDKATHGKGTVQRPTSLRPFVRPANPSATNDPGQLKVTMSKFYRASGASTQKRGVLPDIVLPSVVSYSKDFGEEAMENPLEYDTIPSADYKKLDLVMPCLAELLKRSTERVQTDQEYVYIREDIEQFRKNQADKTISLNEKQRLKEKEEADARQKARDKERKARKESNEIVHELTLKQVDLPGLPPPTNAVTAKKIETNGAPAGTSPSLAVNHPKIAEPAAGTDLEDDEEKPPVVDAVLEESEHILVDYIRLVSQKNLITGSPTRATGTN